MVLGLHKYLNNDICSLLKNSWEKFVFTSLFCFSVIFVKLYSLIIEFISLFFIQKLNQPVLLVDLYGIIVRNLKCLSIWGCFLTVAAQQTFLHFQSDCCSALVHIDCTDCTHVNVHSRSKNSHILYWKILKRKNHKTIE